MKHLSAIISFVVVLLLVFISFETLMPSGGSLASTPDTEFSTERALVPLKEISKKPHFHGTEEHTRVRSFLVSELQKLGLEVEVQEGFVLSGARRGLIKPKNIVARLKGNGRGKSLVLLSHYDSALVPSLGASDAGSGVVTILESLRAYKASGKTPTNDVVILFSDGEEIGLDGASLFVNEHRWAKNVGLVLNFEARGSGGPSNMIVETNGGNTNLIKAFAAAKVEFPVASSLMYSVYKMLPNDTDSTVFKEDGDIESFFFAFIDDHYDYHTVNDNVENLDIETLQHQGTYLLPLLHYFADADLNALKTLEDSVYVNMPFIKFIHYPFSWILPMVVIAGVLFFILLFYGISKHKLNLASIGRGFLPFLFSLVLCGIIGFFGWKLIEWLYPQYAEVQHGFKYNGHWYIAFFVSLSLAIIFIVYHIFSKRTTVVNLLVAPLFFWIILNLAIFMFIKGAGFFIIPIFFGLLSWFILLKWSTPSYIGMALLGAPAVFIFAPLIQFFPIGLGSDHIVISCVVTVLLFGLLLPVLGFYKMKNILAYLFFGVAFVFFIISHFKSEFSETRQKPNSLVYYQDIDNGDAFWLTYDTILDNWTKSYLGEKPKPAANYVEASAGSKYNSGYTYAGVAPKIDIPPFKIRLEKDTITNGLRDVTFTYLPQRDVHQIMLYADKDIAFEKLSFNGVSPKTTDVLGQHFFNRPHNNLLRYYVADKDSLEVRYVLPEKAPQVTFKALEYSLNLMDNKILNVKAREKTMMPKPFINTDAVIVSKSFKVTEMNNKKVDSVQ
ncbi:aminopeptidase [Patiriisocius marinistellae]|uniref:Vacuolar membrane protease n=1 Tax=Patiriisocius marinistellae TaxID=2494560 RepID=A0A5J4FUP4_9FLAO|nr:M20/M25/M40 family metallo-hydrolase [Patiriisocius marinistellae]GEQ84744.1 aminopeptidase [Patiriisocius marinistellae]